MTQPRDRRQRNWPLSGITVAVAASCGLILTACSGGGDSSAITTSGSTILYAAGSPPHAVMEARVGGSLELTDGGCWAVGDGEAQTLVKFPYGSKLTADGRQVEVPDFGTIGVGDTIDGSGGYGSSLADTPAECGGEGQPMVFWQVASR